MFGVINKIIRDEEQACDILQDTFVKVWKNSGAYDKTKGRLFTWLLNIARNAAIDATRSKRNKAEMKNQSLDNSVKSINRAKSAGIAVDHIGLKDIVEKLKPEHKQIIDLLFYGGFTQDEASKELNIPLGTIKTRSRTALLELREMMKEKKIG